MMHEKPAISIVGLGKLGAPMVACFASSGYKVIGVDNKEDVIRCVNSGKAPSFEPGMDSLFRIYQKSIRATDDYNEALANTSITFIVVPTPSDEKGGFSLEYVIPSCKEIGKALEEKHSYHLVVLTSTVLPGSTEKRLKPILEEASKKKCNDEFGLCYNPEFIALGNVIHDFLNPDFVLVGESDKKAGDILESLYREVCDSHPPITRMNFVNAELAKLAVNTYVTTKITFANTLARICERIPDANVDVVTSAIGQDERIGNKYLKGSIGYGGPCFPRDNLAFSHLAKIAGVASTLASETDRINREQIDYLLELVRSKTLDGDVIGILGLSYKPDTYVVEESQGLLLSKELIDRGYKVCAYDPMGMEDANRYLAESLEYCQSAEDCIEASDLVVISTPWSEFGTIPPEIFARQGRKRILIDCWRILDQEKFEKTSDYEALGIWNEDLGGESK